MLSNISYFLRILRIICSIGVGFVKISNAGSIMSDLSSQSTPDELGNETRKALYNHTNDIFQAAYTGLDLLLVDKDGNEIGYPFLTVIIECMSGCIAGFHVGLCKPRSHEFALALRHAILPKQYGAEYDLKHNWNCRGIPKHLIIDQTEEIKTQYLKQISTELGFQILHRAYPSPGGLVESVFYKFDNEFFIHLLGYEVSNVQKRSKGAQKYACFTIEEFEKEIVKYIVNHYNGKNYPRRKDQTRLQRWESNQILPPNVPDERKLDLCLLEKSSVRVQQYGAVTIFSQIFQGDCLLDSQIDKVILRYDPSNITQIFAYTEEKIGAPSRFLGVLKILNMGEEKLSLATLIFAQKNITSLRKKTLHKSNSI